MITSSDNAQFKFWLQLRTQRKARLMHQCAILDGIHLVSTALEQRQHFVQLMVADSAQQHPQIQALLKCIQAPVAVLTDKLFAALTELVTPTGILAVVALPISPGAAQHGTILALEGVQDPGNVGTILRTAAAFGVDQVWLDNQCADIWSPKVLRAGMGAQFIVPCLSRVALLPLVQEFPGQKLVTALDTQSVALPEVKFQENIVFIMGNEGAGVSEALTSIADHTVVIPMRAEVESLNVSIATAICLYEYWRQRVGK